MYSSDLHKFKTSKRYLKGQNGMRGWGTWPQPTCTFSSHALGMGQSVRAFQSFCHPSQDHPGGRYKCNLHFVGKGTAVWRTVEPGAGGG